MSSAGRAYQRLWLLAVAALTLGGCSNPDAPAANRAAEEPAVSSPGEPSAPPPPPASSLVASNVKRTPGEALCSFAVLYVNWSYRTLTRDQRSLAAISVAGARRAELQAAASSAADSTLRASRLANSGTVVSIASDRTKAGSWVIVTHERTTGAGDYEGLPSTYHVTVARLARVPGGYAVSEWLPQS